MTLLAISRLRQLAPEGLVPCRCCHPSHSLPSSRHGRLLRARPPRAGFRTAWLAFARAAAGCASSLPGPSGSPPAGHRARPLAPTCANSRLPPSPAPPPPGKHYTASLPKHDRVQLPNGALPLAGFGSVGAGGIPPYAIQKIYCVVKAYSSAVGAGEFVSEIFGEEAEELRRRGGDEGEYGATTGRPRQVGWLDLVAARYGCMVQGATDVAFTVLDALGYLDEIPVCVAYELDGKRLDAFPPTAQLKRCKPILEKLPGWKCDIRGIKKYEDLPENARNYVEFAEKALGVPVTMVSNGSSREDIIYRS